MKTVSRSIHMGRSKYLDIVIRNILKGNKVLIYGIRGIGKTTFLNLLSKHLKKLVDMVTVYINPVQYKKPTLIKMGILNNLSEIPYYFGYNMKGTLSYKLIMRCKREKGFKCIKNVKEQLFSDFNLRTLIAIDDIHIVPQNLINELQEVLDVATSLKPLNGIRENVKDVVLTPFNLEELGNMLNEINIMLEDHILLEILKTFTGIPAYLSLIITPMKSILRKGLPVDISFIRFLYDDEKFQYIISKIAENFYYSYKRFFGEELVELYYLIKSGDINSLTDRFIFYEKLGFLTKEKHYYQFTDKHLYRFLDTIF